MKKVLIVDDNNGFTKVISREIEHSGFQTVISRNGVDALIRYLDGDIDIVLMDVVMPKLSGIDALRVLRRLDPGAHIVIFTGNPSSEMRLEALGLGAADFLTKPFSLQVLMDLLEQKRGNETSAPEQGTA